MKKSKIIGLSLGLTALAATAVATPFVISSCSTTDSDLVNVNPVDSLFGNPQVDQNQSCDIIVGENTATIYVKDSKKLSFNLMTDKTYLGMQEVEGYDFSTFAWEVADNENYSLVKNQDNFIFTTKKDLSTCKSNLMQVNLEGTVELTKIQEPGQQPSQNPEKITKKVSIKLYIRRGYFDKTTGEYVKPDQAK